MSTATPGRGPVPAGAAARRPGRVRNVLAAAVVVAVFAGVLPRMAPYAEVGDVLQGIGVAGVLLLAAMTVVNLASYPLVGAAALPGLGWRRALMADQASTAVANTLPGGVALGIGTTATFYTTYGFSPEQITRTVAVTGLWNSAIKLLLPVVVLVAVAVSGEGSPTLVRAATTGLVLLLLAVAALVLGLRRPGTAAAAGRGLSRATGLLHRRTEDWPARARGFQAASVSLLRHRWLPLSLAALASHSALLLLLLVSVRVVAGPAADEAATLDVMVVFAVTRLVTIVPITPGAVGVAELSYVAGLTGAGVEAPAAAAAVLVFRALTWFVPIPVGAVAWLLWRRGVGHRAGTG